MDVLFDTAAWSGESLAREAAHCRFAVVILSLGCGRKAAITIVSRYVPLGAAVHVATDKLGTKDRCLKFPCSGGKEGWAEWLRGPKDKES